MNQHPWCRLASLITIASVFLALRTSQADSRDPAAADALFREGREAMKRGDFVTACPKFAESQRLDPAGGTLLNLAECEEKRGMVASAQQHYREAGEAFPANDPRIAYVERRVAELDGRVPRITVGLAATSPAGTRVFRDGVELGAASLGAALPVDPGEHVIVVKAAGRQDARLVVSAKEGETKAVQVAAGGSKSEPVDAGPPTTTTPWRSVGYVIGGAGVVALGVGVAFALRAKSKDDDARSSGCDDHTCPWGDQRGIDLTSESRDSATVARVAILAGGLATVGGAGLVLFAPSQSRSRSATVRVAPSVGSGGLGLEARGAW